MMSWPIIVSGALLLLFFMLWKEITRANRSRLAGRLVASIIAALSLLGMAWSLIEKKVDDQERKEVILLTDGFIADSIKNLQQHYEKNLPVYAMERQNPMKTLEAKAIGDASFFSGDHAPAAIHIFGSGLSKDQLQRVAPIPVVFHPTRPKPALHAIHWTDKIKTGEQLVVQGIFHNNARVPVKILLRGFGKTVDSASIAANSEQDFALAAFPKNTGRAVYSLLAFSGNDTIENNPLPVEVSTTTPMKILMLASSPNFENKFLKNWLSGHGYALTVRTTISRNKYARQFLNMPKGFAGTISPAILDGFDLVIADLDEMQSISKPELENIRLQVEQKGLGLIVRADTAANSYAFYMQSFPLFQLKRGRQEDVSLQITGSPDASLKLSVENAVGIKVQPVSRALIRDEASTIFAGATMYGLGTIVVTTLDNTYGLVLAGNNSGYESLWSSLLQQAARKVNEKDNWSASPILAYTGEPVKLVLETTGGGIPKIQAEESDVAPAQNILLPFLWQGNYWPLNTGWQQVAKAGGRPYWWYVFQGDNYKGLAAFQNASATQKYADKYPYDKTTISIKPTQQFMKYLPLLFFLAFVCGCGFLWIEEKI